MKCHLLLFLGVFCVLVSRVGSYRNLKNCQLSTWKKDFLFKCYEDVRKSILHNPKKSQFELSDRFDIIKGCSEFDRAMAACNVQFGKEPLPCKVTKKQPELLSNYSIPHTAGLKFVCADIDNLYEIIVERFHCDCNNAVKNTVIKCFKENPLVDLKNEYSEAFCSKAKEGMTCFHENLNSQYRACPNNERAKNTWKKYFEEIAAATPCSEAN